MNELKSSVHEAFLAALLDKDYEKLNFEAEELYPVDIANLTVELEDESIFTLCNHLNDEKLSEVLEEASEEIQERLVDYIENNRMLILFRLMSKDNVVDILGELPVKRRKDIIVLMKSGERKVIEDLLGYDKSTAGGIMTTEYISLDSNLTIFEATDKIREIAPRTEIIDVIFLINQKKELIGTIDIRDILSFPNDEKLIDIMQTNVITVDPSMDQEEVSLLVSKYDLKAIPVINKKNALLGVITVDDIIDVIVEEHTEDILKLGGVSVEETIYSSALESVQRRLPWLFVNLATAFLAAFTVNLFSSTISKVVALAAAMPIVAGMGGNAGTQSLSIIIRSIALGEADLRRSWKLVFKEIISSVINGVFLGIVTGVILYFMYGNFYLGLIIFAAMIINLIIAGSFGFLIPLVLKKFNIDPAVASSIFLTTATDVCGFFVFLGLAQLFLPLLV